MTLYEKVEMLCKQRGINISNLGDAVGIKVDKSTISHWKKGAVPRASTVKAIADFFEVTVDYLTNGSATIASGMNYDRGSFIDMFNKMDVVQQAQLLAYAAELLK